MMTFNHHFQTNPNVSKLLWMDGSADHTPAWWPNSRPTYCPGRHHVPRNTRKEGSIWKKCLSNGFMVYDGLWWLMVYDGLRWFMMVYGLWWFMVYDGLWLFWTIGTEVPRHVLLRWRWEMKWNHGLLWSLPLGTQDLSLPPMYGHAGDRL